MFLYEKDLKESFFEKYKSRPNIKCHSFERWRFGGMDLVTFELLNNNTKNPLNYQVNVFDYECYSC